MLLSPLSCLDELVTGAAVGGAVADDRPGAREMIFELCLRWRAAPAVRIAGRRTVARTGERVRDWRPGFWGRPATFRAGVARAGTEPTRVLESQERADEMQPPHPFILQPSTITRVVHFETRSGGLGTAGRLLADSLFCEAAPLFR
jgi:hypothetical protein